MYLVSEIIAIRLRWMTEHAPFGSVADCEDLEESVRTPCVHDQCLGPSQPVASGPPSDPESAVGLVSEQQVYLQRVRRLTANGWRPVFIGSFQKTDGHVRLAGRFVMHPLEIIFFTFCLAMIVLGIILAAIHIIVDPMSGLKFSVVIAVIFFWIFVTAKNVV